MVAAITLVVPIRIIGIGIANGTTMMTTDIIGGVTAAEPSSDKTNTAGQNCITRLDGAVGARGTTQSKTASANRTVATEIHL
jgi:hypothetical protein